VIHVLLGERLKGYDVKHAGVATHFVTSEKVFINELLSKLNGKCKFSNITTVDIMKIPVTGTMINA